MEDFSKLLNAIAALLAAIAWPAGIIIVTLLMRSEIKAVLREIPLLIGRVKKASFPGVQIELERAADQAEQEKSGEITPKQLQAANRIIIEKDIVGQQSLLADLDRLCLEYDALRRKMKSGAARTQAMTRVLIKMRVLAPSLTDHIESYMNSASAGSRLAAVAMMQMSPRVADVDWLRDRFFQELPFVFYHAALALDNFANTISTDHEKTKLIKVATEAKTRIEGFDGTPDEGTLEVLDSLIGSLS